VTERLPTPDTSLFPPLRSDHLRVLPAGHQLGRIYSLGGTYPTTWSAMRAFGPTRARFDHHPYPKGPHRSRRVMYGAPNSDGISVASQSILRTCLAEVYRDRGVIELSRDTPYFALFDISAELQLLDVADGPWITEAGGNAAVSSGPRGAARAWARAIYRTYPSVAGMIYTCFTIPPARSVVLWERAEHAIPTAPSVNRPLADPALRADIEVDAAFLRLELVP
jgi:hypothetical protein